MFFFKQPQTAIVSGIVATGGSAPAFDPATVPNMRFWYDPSDLATIAQSAGKISQINDKSGNAYHMTQPTGAQQPTVGANMNALNNINTTFAQRMALPSGVFDFGSSAYTLFIVLKKMSLTGDDRSPFCFGDATNTPQIGFFSVNGAQNAFMANGNAGAFNGGSFAQLTDPHIASIKATPGASASSFRKDGNVVVTPYTVTMPPSAAVTYGVLNGISPSGGNGGDFVYGDIIGYQRALTKAEENYIGAGLAAKWGLAWTPIP